MDLPDRFQFLLNRMRERLWVKPVIACILSVAGVLLAHVADAIPIDWKVPEIAQGSIIDLLKIIAASGLSSNEQNSEIQNLNVDAFLAKPYTAEKLLTTIAEVLQKK